MSDNNERELTDDKLSEDIDSVLSRRKKDPPQGAPADPVPRPGQRFGPDYSIWDKGRAGAGPATSSPSAERSDVHAPGQRIQSPDAIPRPRPVPQQNAAPRAVPQQNAAPRTVSPQNAAPRAVPQQNAAPRAVSPQNAAPRAVPQHRSPAPAAQGAPAAKPGPAPQHTAPAANGDEDVKVAGKKIRSDKSETKVTDVGGTDTVQTSKTAGVKKKKKKDDDVGGSIVSSLLKTVIYLVTVTVIAVVLSIFIINVGNDVFAFVKSDELVEVTIPENATRDDIADILYENGVINYKTAFKIYGSLKKIEENFVAGDYTVSPSMNYKQLYSAFKEKPLTGTQWVTIPEGFTADEIIDLMLSYNIGGTKEDYVKAINEGDFSEFWFVKELDENGYDANRFYKLEGYLFPDTYEFYNASDAYTVVKKMLKRFDEVYGDKLKARADELGMTTDQVVILASIIEKEAGSSSDFRNVSSVFHNRLADPYNFPRFESDATVVYAIAHERGVRPKEITAKMMEYNSPYNSYTHEGYPPGAISNPGMNALKYALYPADTYYYYFVSYPNGETVFATNAYEQEQNIARLREMQESGE